MMKLIVKCSIAVFGLLVAAPAFAQDEPDTKIEGEVVINASAKNVVTIAGGNSATATTDVGVVSGSTIRGDVRINATATEVVTGALGSNSTASTQVGAVTDSEIDGNVTINASLDNSATIAAGSDACAQTRVGVIGRDKCKKK